MWGASINIKWSHERCSMHKDTRRSSVSSAHPMITEMSVVLLKWCFKTTCGQRGAPEKFHIQALHSLYTWLYGSIIEQKESRSWRSSTSTHLVQQSNVFDSDRKQSCFDSSTQTGSDFYLVVLCAVGRSREDQTTVKVWHFTASAANNSLQLPHSCSVNGFVYVRHSCPPALNRSIQKQSMRYPQSTLEINKV